MVSNKQQSPEDEQIAQLEKIKQLVCNTFFTESGKILMEELEKMYWIHQPNYMSNERDHAFNEGQRSVVLWLKNMQSMSIDKLKEELRQNENG